MAADVGAAMNLRLHRRRSDFTLRKTISKSAGDNPKQGRPGKGEVSHGEIELLEYEWPDLPPLPALKDAITRSRASCGISYLLPVDKGRNSINSHFRTDLRAIFQEPYFSEDLRSYDDERVKVSAKVHFRFNTADGSRWTRGRLRTVPVRLNAESEEARCLYSHSAPSGGRVGGDCLKMRMRSNLFLPLKAAVPAEMVKLRQEVEQMIRSVQEDLQAWDDLKPTQSQSEVPAAGEKHSAHEPGESKVQLEARAPGTDGSAPPSIGQTEPAEVRGSSAVKYERYDVLKAAKPPKPVIPAEVKSQYLSDEKNQEIWQWLHHGEEQNDFDFFLSVCG